MDKEYKANVSFVCTHTHCYWCLSLSILFFRLAVAEVLNGQPEGAPHLLPPT